MTDNTKGDIAPKKSERSKTGVKFDGSNKEGNIVELSKHDGLKVVFGTDCDELASA